MVGKTTPFGLFCILLLVVILSDFAKGQEFVVVGEIELRNHKKTSDNVIYRELDIAVGDTILIKNVDEVITNNKKRLLSTGLFNVINVNVKEWEFDNQMITIDFDFKENWYIYPSIIWEYADRSFNVWWKDHRFDFSRTNYGVRVDHLNLSGHKDRLKLKLQGGYTNKYELEYTLPYFIGNWGLGSSLFYATNKEMGYKTEENRTVFYRHPEEDVVLTRLRAGFSLSNRANAYAFHNVRIEYHENTIHPIVGKDLNPDYFLNQNDKIRFFYVEYDLQYDKRVFPSYPEGGYLLFLNIKKEGVGLFKDYDNLSLFGGLEKFWAINENLVYGGRIKAKLNLNRNKVGFANNTGLGYGDEVRGYELYVVDGTDFLLTRTDLKYRLMDRIFDISKYMFIDEFDLLPMGIWIRLSADTGYVNEPTYKRTNFLANSWLVGGGPAIDLLLYNNYRLSIEYNFNLLGESGLFFQSSFNF